MRSSKSRSRNKANRQRSLGNIVNRVFDSSGPEGKVRGTPQQIIEKYLALARDAHLGNDRVAEQAFLQHAEHYTRMLGEAQRELAREQEQRQGQGGPNGGQSHGGSHAPQGAEGRERYDQRPGRDEDDQPDYSPLGTVESDDDGPGLVETPEMYHAPEPVAFEGQVPDFLNAPAPAPQSDDRGRRDRRDRRGPRGGGEQRSEAGEPAAAERSSGEQPEKRERGPRGPRKPKAPRAEGEGPVEAAPANQDE